jgi:hypothetical protein
MLIFLLSQLTSFHPELLPDPLTTTASCLRDFVTQNVIDSAAFNNQNNRSGYSQPWLYQFLTLFFPPHQKSSHQLNALFKKKCKELLETL